MVPGTQGRVDWVDAAKGICIIFVVMMHSTLGAGEAIGREGWMHHVVSFARPFRMPDFFLISGLFLGLVIDRSWRRYADRKVVHFLYFYVLWLSTQFVFRAPGMAMEGGLADPFRQYLLAFVQPFGTLWFIYILPIFFLFTRAVKPLPVWLVLGWAAFLEMLPVHTGWGVFDEFCARYVYFFAGYALAPRIFDIAAWMRANRGKALALLTIWAAVNGMLVFSPVPDALVILTDGDVRLATLPLVSLALGMGGAMAIIAVATLVTRFQASAWLTWLGAHSIVVYLAFFLPMSTSRIIMVKTGIVTDVGLLSALVTIAGVTGPVVLYGLIQWTGRGRFLFERPGWARIESAQPKPGQAFEAAE
jgi:uncharacterized membrane protein YcfT